VRDGVESKDTHCSETMMSSIKPDYTLCNDTTLDNLVANVDSLVRLLRANGRI
jgi:hypothetical protein